MTLRVAILDMQPIDPPVGGGRLRLLGLYRDLGPGTAARYVGSYDWAGPGFRRQHLSEGLEEILVPLSAAHFATADARAKAAGGRVVIDTTFHELAHLSPDYVNAVRAATAEADVVVLSHPWAFPLIDGMLDRGRQLLVYDAQNVEGLLRTDLLDDGGAGTDVARGVVAVERALCAAADLILACSREDAVLFANLYEVPAGRLRVVPNGTFTNDITPADAATKAASRAALGLDAAPVAFFIGSQYGPNVDAARFIATRLAPAVPDVLFAIGGGVGTALTGLRPADNLRITGPLTDGERLSWLEAADIAVNPMAGGSGTNIKMLDFMAAGLPIIATATGARGLDTVTPAFIVAAPAEFAAAVANLAADPARCAALGQAARREAVRCYSWERISRTVGQMLARHAATHGRRPELSVMIVANGEHPDLSALLPALGGPETEVIVLDRGATRWTEADAAPDVVYVNVHAAGLSANEARNRGADLAAGSVLAFIDMRCKSALDWLAVARPALADAIAVVEDTTQPAETNLLVTSTAFHAAGGFRPSASDDDLLWRLQQQGPIATIAGEGRNRAPAPVRREAAPLGWISTWNVRCGIAEYSRYLVDALPDRAERALTVFADDRSLAEIQDGITVRPCWELESGDIDALAEAVAGAAPNTVVLQHHPALIPWSALAGLLVDQRLANRRLIVTLHNAQHLLSVAPAERAAVGAALQRPDLVLVHARADLDRLRRLGLSRNVRLFPQGARAARAAPPVRALAHGAAPLIGCFGFFLPHKGIYPLIEAVARLRATWPGLRLRLANAAYPRADSTMEIDRCRELAAARGLDGAIEWLTEFLPEEQALDLLGECDVVALPYAATEESSSAALRMALASGAPVAVTRATIFDEAEGAVARMAGETPIRIATTLHDLILDAPRRRALQRSAAAWSARHAWPRMGQLMAGLLAPGPEAAE